MERRELHDDRRHLRAGGRERRVMSDGIVTSRYGASEQRPYFAASGDCQSDHMSIKVYQRTHSVPFLASESLRMSMPAFVLSR